MTKKKRKVRGLFHSLYLKLVLVILVGSGISIALFAVLRALSFSYINANYISDEKRTVREQNYINELRQYIALNSISINDAEKLAEWSQDNRYVYLLVYKNNELFFSSDMLPYPPVADKQPQDTPENKPDTEAGDENPGIGDETNPDGEEGENTEIEDEKNPENKEEEKLPANKDPGRESFGSGITVNYPTRDELKKYAQENDLYELEMTDGVLLASVAEFTEYFYYDVANISSLAVAMIVLAFILVNYLRRIVVRVKRLDKNVMLVAGGDINRPIKSDGYDELSRLSENVENMRCTILESIEEERKARQSNTELITAMSHDIRTPLTVLLGYLDIMKNEAESENMRSYVEATEKTALRLKNLSDDMFNYFLAFGNTKENVNIEEYDAVTLFDQMLSEHLVLLGEQGYKVEFEKMESDFAAGSVVKTDAPKLMRIVDNLFSNIRKYADASKPITVRLDITRELFSLEIENYISDTVSEVQSSGIGLNNCKRLAPLVAKSFGYIKGRNTFTVKLEITIIPPEN